MNPHSTKIPTANNVSAPPTWGNNPHSRGLFAAAASADELSRAAGTTPGGLAENSISKNRAQFGANIITHGKKDSLAKRLSKAFINPFTAILFGLALVSVFTDIVLAEPGEADYMAVTIITAMVLLSGLLRFIQETRSDNAAEKLLKMITVTTNVERLGSGPTEIPLDSVVVGDVVHLSAGDMVPADVRVIEAKDLFISQSSLTGESEPIEKFPTQIAARDLPDAITECHNLAFMGTNVVSGTAKGIVFATGSDTLFGELAKTVNAKPVKTTFEKGVNSVSWVLIRFMGVMVPLVLLINGFTKGNWMEALLFALAVAVGLTPEMLPMIVTTCLAKGAVAMSRQRTIVKNLNAIQNLGSMDILCTDKTGTLTQDDVVLMYTLNINGHEDARVLRHAYLNSYYQTGLKNLMDVAIIKKTQEIEETDPDPELEAISNRYYKLDEIPFDFDRRRMSVVVKNNATDKTQIITKGAIEEMLSVCTYTEYQGEVVPLTKEMKNFVLEQVNTLNQNGMRVLGVAHKSQNLEPGHFAVSDESDMVLLGFLAFLDPPKESAASAIQALHQHGVAVKILTGDNDKVTAAICKKVGLPVDRILLGADVAAMNDGELAAAAEHCAVFAKLSPQQKARVITALREGGHSVGYMGDGINDAAAMKASDVGISVDTAVDIAKESADVILLDKDLMVLERGIVEGRKTYANMIKYIKMTASSNFGNMFSVLAASAFLPFLPMLSIHLILLNLIYDLSCSAIPWDNVDADYLQVPRKWDAGSVSKFMLWIGPTSSVFDITTYLLMFFVICPAVFGPFRDLVPGSAPWFGFIAMFHAGWFVESMWSQTLVIHMIRTPRLPFIQSHASAPLTLLTFAGIAVLTVIPFTPFGASIGFVPLPPVYFLWLAATIAAYMVLVTIFKRIFIRRYGELL